ncbi:MAG TPA: agmatinase, partial [bacterium]|nr:agmatinase [bacterium]
LAILDASAALEFYDIETETEVYKNGIFTDKPIYINSAPEQMVLIVQKKIEDYIKQNKFVVCLGGEHSISIGAIFAYADNYKNLSVLQLDAHSDLRDEYNGSKYNHACVMARVLEKCKAVQVGIRSMDIIEKNKNSANNIFYAEQILKRKNWKDKVVDRLNENVYITIDLDVFDPAIMPATGTPEPGGLFWYDVLELLKKVVDKKNVVGFDVVELCPNKVNRHCDFLAAKLIYKLLSYIFAKDKK